MGTMRSTGKLVAIKMISKDSDGDQRMRVMAEHRVLAVCADACPFVVQMHSAFQTKVQSLALWF